MSKAIKLVILSAIAVFAMVWLVISIVNVQQAYVEQQKAQLEYDEAVGDVKQSFADLDDDIARINQ